MARPKKEEVEVKSQSPEEILNSELKANKADHYNDSEEVIVPKVSSGSLILDTQLGGGFDSGLIRFVGFTEAGKSSAAYEVARNFMAITPKSRCLTVKAEGRLSPQMQERTGIKFVWKAEEWVEGTCFVLETNVYELVINLMRKLVVDNPENNRYCFILDSMDGLILKSDLEKGITENGKVAGAPALTKKFLQRLAIAMNKFGHRCIMIGQVSAKVEIDPYAPKDNRQISATGGNGALHFANWILQFEHRNQGDLIKELDDKAPDPLTNRILGHWCRLVIKKSPNEKSGLPVRYPIKYGRKGGKSVWREYEIVETLFMFEKISKKGAWLTIDADLVKEIKDTLEIECKELHQGKDQLMTYLEDNENITDFLFEKLKKMIS